MRRTARGKVVGSYQQPLSAWTYWAERSWKTREPGFVTVAPSGARMKWFADESDAQRHVAEKNAPTHNDLADFAAGVDGDRLAMRRRMGLDA